MKHANVHEALKKMNANKKNKKNQSERARFKTRTIVLGSPDWVALAINLIKSVPIDELRPLIVVIMEAQERRKVDQNKAMWAGLLRDIERDAYVGGKQYRAEIWHEYFKREFLPDEYDEMLCLKGYEKWGITPGGDRVLRAGTGDLTVRGFALYLLQIEAAGSNMGVMFSSNPNHA